MHTLTRAATQWPESGVDVAPEMAQHDVSQQNIHSSSQLRTLDSRNLLQRHARTTENPLRRTLFPALVAALLSPALSAQIVNVNNLTTVPTPGTGHDYIHGLSEVVDPASGALSLRIGVPTPEGRGISLRFAFAYDSNGVYTPFLAVYNQGTNDPTSGILWTNTPSYLSDGGWTFTWPSAQWSKMIGEIFVTVDGRSSLTSYCTVATNYTFTDSDGSRYPLYVSNGGAQSGPTYPCAIPPQTPAWNGTGGQGPLLATLQQADASQSFTGALVVTDGDGSVYNFQGPQQASGTGLNTFTTVASSITDRNGNQITLSDQGYGAITATDTLDRSVVAASGFGISGTSTTNTISVSGTSGSYQVSWEPITAKFTPGTNSSVTGQCAPEQTTSALQVVKSITLPNNQIYLFGYDSTYGLINSITYPSGAYITYTWGYASEANQATYSYKYGSNNAYSNGCVVEMDTPVVTDRYVYAGGMNSPLTKHDHFGYATDWNYAADGMPWKTTTVTSSDSSYTRVILYSYAPYIPPTQPWENGPPSSSGQTTYVDPAIPLEISAKYEDGNGNVLRTVSETWNNPRVMTSQQTLLDNGQSSTSIRCFNGYEQVTQDDEYGFASDGTAGTLPNCPTGSSDGSPLSPTGPLMKQTITAYSASLEARNIVDRPQSVEQDGTGSTGQWAAPAGYTLYCYDQYALASVSPIQFSDPGTAVRGNATQMLKWLIPAGGSNPLPSCGQSTSSNALVNNYYFDNAGQLLTSVDARGNATTYTWGEAAGEPSVTTDGFLTRVTDALGYYDGYAWNWTNGLMTSHSDLNRQTTNFYYTNMVTGNADPFNRLGKIDFPDSGETRIYYGDSPGDLYSEVQRQMTTTQYADSFTYLDGLGRTISTASASGSGNWNCTQTSYDGFDEKSFVSYPYESASSACSPSSGGDTSVYDPLGRQTQLVHSADGSSRTWTYTGPSVKLKDENGNQWQRTSDGINRLIKVLEPNGIGQNPLMATTYTYDALENLYSVVQAGDGSSQSRNRSFTYDSVSRLTSATNPESGSITYGYDADGNVTSKVSPAVNVGSGTQTIGYCYDSLNRMVYKFYSGSFNCANPAGYSAAYAYDTSAVSNSSYVVGRLTYEASLVSGQIVSERFPYQYDSMGRLEAEQQCTLTGCGLGTPPTCSYLCVPTSPNTVSYQYDLAGDIKYSSNGMSTPPPGASAPLTFTSQYDAGEHLQCMTSSWNDISHPPALFAAQTTAASSCSQTVPVAYTPFGALQGAVFGNGSGSGIVLNRSYDSRMRIQNETDSGAVVSPQ